MDAEAGLMGFTGQILASYRDPGGVVARMLASGQREDRLLAILVAACVLLFVAQMPVVQRARLAGAGLDGTPETLVGLLSPYLFALVFLLPLIAYGFAALTHLVARLAGGRGSFYGARLALFWALLCVAPLMLLQGLVAGLVGPGPSLTLTQFVVFGAFLWIWSGGLYAAEYGVAT